MWRPDVYGSTCFLVASALALAIFGRSWYSWRHRFLAGAYLLLPRPRARQPLAVGGAPAAS